MLVFSILDLGLTFKLASELKTNVDKLLRDEMPAPYSYHSFYGYCNLQILERDYTNKEGEFFVPTMLGMSLVKGYDGMDMEISLSKPDLRALVRALIDDRWRRI